MINQLFMPLHELESYYREKRKRDFEKGRKLKAIHARKAFYPCFKIFLKIDRLFRRQKIIVLGNKPSKKGQYIFACTHIGENDLENIYESIGRSCWWFVGDPGFMYKDISGLLTWLNGCIFLDLPHRDDCHIAFYRAVELLKDGGSLMIFPEGARNGSENLPVLKLFPGTARMAIQTGVKIIPVGIEQYEKRFVIKFGDNICPEEFESEENLNVALRDTLASLKWDIWENEGIQKRNHIPENYKEMFYNDFERKIYPYDTLETIERAKYRSKEEQEYLKVYEDLIRLKKRIKGN